ncbi:SDR family NAD(P)-dependent oxidoreductase [Bosea caraganae]|uniref:SDR family NAD(P)-dependent oxidoreductase n=1 Tax=Bosea caraganae TaxID=2763117 RepID=A0A370L5N0_9HYPH|nr:SDR family oxidoreductase [Bosea caraganae]RDJ23313.1 SDR family NAD(P)-dependent oxidoreductase [Bosea caraganae]RDJ24575.1 SDR family NAD(P)-dependent oxidoreductase [Bosea caraganae]
MPRPVLLVTGGSRGIGAATCIMAAQRGYDVAVNYQSDAAAAAKVVASCAAAGARAVAVQGDMASEADITRIFAEAKAALGPLTHVVNNAGITGPSSKLAEADAQVIRTCIDVNVTGAILVAREAARALLANGAAKNRAIVNISSIAAGLGAPDEFVWYAASKGAIESLTIGLAKELAPAGIRVNAVAPGMTETDIHAVSSGEPGRVARIAPTIPLKRAAQPEEIAEAVLFVLSEAASYMVGSIVRVGGGR